MGGDWRRALTQRPALAAKLLKKALNRTKVRPPRSDCAWYQML